MDVDEDMKESIVPDRVQNVLDAVRPEDRLRYLIALKNSIIGSNREKSQSVRHGLVPRLLSWIEDESTLPDLRTEAATVLGSLSKGDRETIDILVEAKSVSILLKSLTNFSLRYTEAVLRSLRSIFQHSTESVSCLYEENRYGSTYIPHLLGLTQLSVVCQECVTSILERCCQTEQHQRCLLASQGVQVLSPLLKSPSYKVQMPTLRCIGKMCHRNPEICTVMYADKVLMETVVDLMGRDKPSEMQMASAQVLTYLHRGGALPATDFVISRKTLGTLVRMCKRDRPLEENVKGAETLAYLVEMDPELQVMASITDHLISTLANYLHYKDVKTVSSCDKKEMDWGSEMKRVAFLVFASISANDEDIREKVIKQDGMVEHIQASFISTNQAEVAASLRCLQSLTRSVQQIRTVLHDNAMWRPLLQMVRSPNRDIMILAMACMCNLVLEFSPSKEALAQCKAVDVFCELCQSPDNTIRLNATWGVMSMSYCASDDMQNSLIDKLGRGMIVKLIQDPVLLIREKALGIVRNLLTNKEHIDGMVSDLGPEVIDSVFGIIRDGDMPLEVLEQGLCTLSNMSDGPSCKAHIIGNTDKIMAAVNFLKHPEKRLMLPAIQFVSNLVDPCDDGSYQRMLELKKLGVQTMLESLVGTSPTDVDIRAQQALKCFA